MELFKIWEFEKAFEKLDQGNKERIEAFFKQFKDQGMNVGKPLGGRKYFREKKFNGYRLYFLVFEELSAVLVVGISNKKTQQQVIDRILFNLPEYKEIVIQLLNEVPKL